MKTKEIRDLIEFISQTGLNEVNIETEELKISVKRNPDIQNQVVESVSHVATAPQVVSQPVPLPVVSEKASEPVAAPAPAKSNLIEIKSPMIGTFYRAANPENPPFVSVGDKVESGSTVGIIEAMKLFNEIETEISGTIVKVLVENATPVEYDQPLFLVEPS